jgi:hypothetical protein
MGWFGGGSREETPPSRDFSDGSTTSFEDLSSSAPSTMGSGSELQDFSMAIQQQMIVQKVISKLTDEAFHKCITSKPSDSLSGSQVACIHSTVNKWMDTNEFMMGRLAKKQQQQQQQQQSGGY